jgi:hypothetical protein
LGFEEQFRLVGEELSLGRCVIRFDDHEFFGDEKLDREDVQACFAITKEHPEEIGIECTRTYMPKGLPYPVRVLRWNPSQGLLFQFEDKFISTPEQDPYFQASITWRISSEQIAPLKRAP